MEEVFAAPDWSSTASSMQSIQQGAMRIAKALARSLVLLPGAVGKNALDILTIENLWTTAIILTVWVFASVIGGPVGLAVNAILIGIALYHLPQFAAELGTHMKDGLVRAARARSDSDLDAAAASFASAESKLGIEVFQIFVTHRIFVFAKPRLLKRFKVPQALEAEHKQARAKVSERLKQEAEERKRKKAEEDTKTGKAKKLAEAAESAARTAAEVGAAAGVKPAADMLPTVGLVALGAAAIGTAAAVVLLVKTDRE